MELKHCPFCGSEQDITDPDSLYPSGTGWQFNKELEMRTYHHAFEVPIEQWCWKIRCIAGCGCELHADSKEEAIEKWNRRGKDD